MRREQPTSQLTDKGRAGIVTLLVTMIFVPFINKAYHIDDPLYLWIARQIQQHPLDFFGFAVNWTGHVKHVAEICNNPPFFAYYLAAVGAFAGWGERAMHLAQLLPVLAVALGTLRLASLMAVPPLMAAVCAVATPVYLLCGTSVMADMTLTALYVWAIWFWVKGCTDKPDSFALLMAVILAAAAGLTKYFGMSLIPLMAIVSLRRRVEVRKWIFFLTVPVFCWGLFEWLTHHFYGYGHISLSSSYASFARQAMGMKPGKALLETLSFMGGGLLFPVLVAPFLFRFTSCVAMAGAVAGMAWLCSLSGTGLPEMFRLSLSGVLLMLPFIAGGAGLLLVAAMDLRRERDAESLLLFCWVFGVLLFNAVMNPFVAGRYLLPVVPAAAIIFARKTRSLSGWRLHGMRASLVLVLATSLLAATADYRYANSIRSVVGQITREWHDGSQQLFFQGHWGMQYYLEEAGGIAFDDRESQVLCGDLMVQPAFASSAGALDPGSYTREKLYQVMPMPWLSTFNRDLRAGFHSSVFGPLPFAFGAIPQDGVAVYRNTGSCRVSTPGL